MPNTPQHKIAIARQLRLLRSHAPTRIGLGILALALATIYLPLWFTFSCMVVSVSSDLASMHYMRGLDPRKHPLRHAVVLILCFIKELSLALSPALIWQQDAHYAKAFAVGMIMGALLQLASTRAVYIRIGQVGVLGVALPAMVSNSLFWAGQDDLFGWLISNIGALAAISYTLMAMRSNNELHNAAALDRALAMENDRTKSRFLAQMSHELRTPLNAILGMGHAELRRNKDALAQRRLSVLIASAEGLSTILDDILDLSAVQEGHLPIRLSAAIPRDEITATLNLFQPGIDERHLKLTAKLAPETGETMLFDRQRLRQCLSNLLSNALKHTDDGGIRVSARLTAGTTLEIEVADTGPGIADDLRSAIFEPFASHRNQIRDETHKTQSNGIGLSICRAMARQMGGDLVLLESDPSTEYQGARFLLTLRLQALPEGHAGTAARQDHEQAGQPSQAENNGAVLQGLRVLVVDDIATNRLVASTYLRMLGARCFEVASGDAALEQIDKNPPDLVLLDMNMPEMDGAETLARIRALPAPKGRLPVIAMTADNVEEHRSHFSESGLNGYLGKPMNLTQIESEITAVLQKARAGPG